MATSCVRRNAFTLVELLVTLTILAVLAAVTLPSLGRARRSGRTAVCLSNLRQLAAACAAYSGTDERSQILPAHPISDIDVLHHDGRYDWGGTSGQSDGWNGMYRPGGPRAAETRPLNRVLFGSPSATTDYGVFRCPDDNGPTDWWPEENWWWTPDFYRRPYFVSVGMSYLGNSLRSHEWNGMQIAPPVEIVGVFLRPASRIPAPGQTVLLQDAAAGIYRSGEWMETYQYGVFESEGIHGGETRYNLAFADAHAATVDLENPFSRGDWRSDPQGYGHWVRSAGVRWDCRPEPLLKDLPDVETGRREAGVPLAAGR